MGLHEVAARLPLAGDELTDVAGVLRSLDPPAGLPDDLARVLADALEARAREASATLAQLSILDDAVRRARAAYAGVDDEARERHDA
jgi:hypothetical protein